MNYTAFLAGLENDSKNRSIEEILAYTDEQLEQGHDYIQEVFPTKSLSMFHLIKPITDKDLSSFYQNEQAKENVRTMYRRMLVFWKIDGDRYKEWGSKAPERLWNKEGDHNHLRMTRVLKSLKLLHLDEEYEDFSKRIREMLQDPGVNLSVRTRKIWLDSIKK